MHGRILRALVAVAASALASQFGGLPTAHADSFLNTLGFEVGGSVAAVDPSEYNEVFQRFGLESIDRTYGIGGAVFTDIGHPFRLFVGSGYVYGSTNDQPIKVTDETGAPLANTTFNYATTLVPVAAGVTYLIGGPPLALTLSLAGEIQYISLTETIAATGDFEGKETSSSTTSFGASVAGGLEWQFSGHFGAGLEAGYRYASGEVSLPEVEGSEMEMDLNGVYGALYVTILPWS